MTAVKCVSTVVHNGRFYKPGEVIKDFDDGEATRLEGDRHVVILNPKKPADKPTDASK